MQLLICWLRLTDVYNFYLSKFIDMNNKIVTLCAIVICFLAVTSSCVLGVGGKKHAPLSRNDKFSGIEVFNSITLYYTPGDSLQWSVKASPRLKSKLQMYVEDDRLRIGADGMRGDDEIEIWLMAPAVSTFTAWVNCTIVVTDSLDVNTLSVTTYNLSEIRFDGEVRAAYADLSAYNNSLIYMESGYFSENHILTSGDGEVRGNIDCARE